MAWIKLNRQETGVGLLRAAMHKWAMAFTPIRKFGERELLANYSIHHNVMHHPLHFTRVLGIVLLDDQNGCQKLPQHLNFIQHLLHMKK